MWIFYSSKLSNKYIAFALDFEKDIGVKAYTLEASEKKSFTPIAYFDCRGCEFVEFDPKVLFIFLHAMFSTNYHSIII